MSTITNPSYSSVQQNRDGDWEPASDADDESSDCGTLASEEEWQVRRYTYTDKQGNPIHGGKIGRFMEIAEDGAKGVRMQRIDLSKEPGRTVEPVSVSDDDSDGDDGDDDDDGSDDDGSSDSGD